MAQNRFQEKLFLEKNLHFQEQLQLLRDRYMTSLKCLVRLAVSINSSSQSLSYLLPHTPRLYFILNLWENSSFIRKKKKVLMTHQTPSPLLSLSLHTAYLISFVSLMVFSQRKTKKSKWIPISKKSVKGWVWSTWSKTSFLCKSRCKRLEPLSRKSK